MDETFRIYKRKFKGDNVIKQLHPIIWNDRNNKIKILIYYGYWKCSNIWYTGIWNKIKPVPEMMYWWQSCKTTITDRVPNQQIWEKFMENNPLQKKLKRNFFVMVTWTNRMPQQMWKWKPQQGRAGIAKYQRQCRIETFINQLLQKGLEIRIQ